MTIVKWNNQLFEQSVKITSKHGFYVQVAVRRDKFL